jgi:hypothetical protein
VAGVICAAPFLAAMVLISPHFVCVWNRIKRDQPSALVFFLKLDKLRHHASYVRCVCIICIYMLQKCRGGQTWAIVFLTVSEDVL